MTEAEYKERALEVTHPNHDETCETLAIALSPRPLFLDWSDYEMCRVCNQDFWNGREYTEGRFSRIDYHGATKLYPFFVCECCSRDGALVLYAILHEDYEDGWNDYMKPALEERRSNHKWSYVAWRELREEFARSQ